MPKPILARLKAGQHCRTCRKLIGRFGIAADRNYTAEPIGRFLVRVYTREYPMVISLAKFNCMFEVANETG